MNTKTTLALLCLFTSASCAGTSSSQAPDEPFSLHPSLSAMRQEFIAGDAPWGSEPRIWVEICPPEQACAALAAKVSREGEELAIRGDYVAHGHGMYGTWLPSIYGALVDANLPAEASLSEGSFRALGCDEGGCRMLIDDALSPAHPTTRVVLPYVQRALAHVGPDAPEESDEEMFMANRMRAFLLPRADGDGSLHFFVETGTEHGIAPSTHVAGDELHALMPGVQSSISRGARGPAIERLFAAAEGVLPHAERVHTFWPPAPGRRRVHIRGAELWVIDLPVCGPLPDALRAFADASRDVALLAAEATQSPLESCPGE